MVPPSLQSTRLPIHQAPPLSPHLHGHRTDPNTQSRSSNGIQTRLRPINNTLDPSASSGSLTITSTSTPPIQPTLRLRSGEDSALDVEPEDRRQIRWAEDVVDNEGLGRKSSKVCCIYHAPRNVDSSSEESSSDSSGNSSSEDDRAARPVDEKKGKGNAYDHEAGCGRRRVRKGSKGKKRDASPNAYENVRHLKREQAT